MTRLPARPVTPATVVLVERLDHNLRGMAALASSVGATLRPHGKTHKCLEIARRQVELGAVGLSVATLGEAEILASESSGVSDVFIAYPFLAVDDSLRRLERLTDRATVSVGVDSREGATRLARLRGRLRVLVEVDSGLRRSGVAPEGAGEVASAAERSGIEVAGVFTFPGHSYAPGAAASAARDEARALAEAARALGQAGFDCSVRSGGSTPSAGAVEPGALSEMRPGVYVFNDAQQVELGTCTMDDVALVVLGTVVSKPARDRVVLDAGAKVLGPDRPSWTTGYGRLLDHPAARITGLWEHHAVVRFEGEEGVPTPDLGDQVAVVPNHVCTAVNLVPSLLVVEHGDVVDEWQVAARAANS